MNKIKAGLTELGRMLPRAAMLAAVMVLPLMAVGVNAGDENIIEHTQKKMSGAGLVLMVSLQRAQ